MPNPALEPEVISIYLVIVIDNICIVIDILIFFHVDFLYTLVDIYIVDMTIALILKNVTKRHYLSMYILSYVHCYVIDIISLFIEKVYLILDMNLYVINIQFLL